MGFWFRQQRENKDIGKEEIVRREGEKVGESQRKEERWMGCGLW